MNLSRDPHISLQSNLNLTSPTSIIINVLAIIILASSTMSYPHAGILQQYHNSHRLSSKQYNKNKNQREQNNDNERIK